MEIVLQPLRRGELTREGTADRGALVCSPLTVESTATPVAMPNAVVRPDPVGGPAWKSGDKQVLGVGGEVGVSDAKQKVAKVNTERNQGPILELESEHSPLDTNSPMRPGPEPDEVARSIWKVALPAIHEPVRKSRRVRTHVADHLTGRPDQTAPPAPEPSSRSSKVGGEVDGRGPETLLLPHLHEPLVPLAVDAEGTEVTLCQRATHSTQGPAGSEVRLIRNLQAGGGITVKHPMSPPLRGQRCPSKRETGRHDDANRILGMRVNSSVKETNKVTPVTKTGRNKDRDPELGIQVGSVDPGAKRAEGGLTGNDNQDHLTSRRTRKGKVGDHYHSELVGTNVTQRRTEAMTDSRSSALKTQHLKGMSRELKKDVIHISTLKTVNGQPCEWEPGQEMPPLVTTVDAGYMHDQDGLEKIRTRAETLLGTAEVTMYMSKEHGPTGEMIIRCSVLSEEGAAVLAKGSWRVEEPEPGHKPDDRGIYAFKGQTVAQRGGFKYRSVNDNSAEWRWDPRQLTADGHPCPGKTEIYKVVEKLELAMYNDGVGLDDEEMVSAETGAAAEPGEEGAVGKAHYAKNWRPHQTRTIHGLTPAWIQFHENPDAPPWTSQGAVKDKDERGKGGKGDAGGKGKKGKGKGTKGAKGEKGKSARGAEESDKCGWRIRFPTGYYKEVMAILRLAMETLGMVWSTHSYPFPQYAIRDMLATLEHGAPMREGQPCGLRRLLKVNCIPTATCPGVMTPAELSAWMWSRCATHMIACGFRQGFVSKGTAPGESSIAFAVLVDNDGPMQAMKINNHAITGSDSVTIKQWRDMDSKGELSILPQDLHIADGKTSVVPQKQKETVRSSSAADVTRRMAEEARENGSKAGLAQSGYVESTQADAYNLMILQKKLDRYSNDAERKQILQQLQAIEDEARRERAAEGEAEIIKKDIAKAAAQQPPSPAKHKRSEITVVIATEMQGHEEFTVEATDVPRQNDRASMQDLVAHLFDTGAFGADMGIDPATCSGFEGTDVTVKVYVEVVVTDPNGAAWACTFGKDAKAQFKKLDTLAGATIELAPRYATAPPAHHPKWLTAALTANGASSPSPQKPAGRKPVSQRNSEGLTACRPRKRGQTTQTLLWLPGTRSTLLQRWTWTPAPPGKGSQRRQSSRRRSDTIWKPRRGNGANRGNYRRSRMHGTRRTRKRPRRSAVNCSGPAKGRTATPLVSTQHTESCCTPWGSPGIPLWRSRWRLWSEGPESWAQSDRTHTEQEETAREAIQAAQELRGSHSKRHENQHGPRDRDHDYESRGFNKLNIEYDTDPNYRSAESQVNQPSSLSTQTGPSAYLLSQRETQTNDSHELRTELRILENPKETKVNPKEQHVRLVVLEKPQKGGKSVRRKPQKSPCAKLLRAPSGKIPNRPPALRKPRRWDLIKDPETRNQPEAPTLGRALTARTDGANQGAARNQTS
jgi:hypothetical protein